MNSNKATGIAAGAVGALTGSLAGFLIGRWGTNCNTAAGDWVDHMHGNPPNSSRTWIALHTSDRTRKV
jgi:membrane protein DedA with SNARE-associated domain